MNVILDAALRSWPFDPWLTIALLLSAAIYLRGWLLLRARDPVRWGFGQPAFFLAGLLALFLALASPIETFTNLLLQVHMMQHLLLMMIAPPFLWLGEPLLPILRGLPATIRSIWVAPLFRSPTLKCILTFLTLPWVALGLYVALTWFWHVPAVYDLALRSDGWHYVEHVCFLLGALLFWYPVVRPFPCRLAWSRWLLIPYLIFADVQNTALAALLSFADEPIYAHYTQVPRLGGITALEDQQVAGALMWVPGSVAFLLPVFIIGVQLLFAPSRRRATTFKRLDLPLISARPSPPAGFDLLRLPFLGRFLHWRHARLALQIPMLILAAIVIWDGLRGPAIGPLNLAGVLPWIHWRALVVIGLLVAGNVFCMACPFLLPRMLARRLFSPRWSWPRRLRNKWPAIVLLGAFLWAYEAFALWDNPWWTAWIALGYFAGALVLDSFFRGAGFCKFVCPIGQFNFVQSLVSPLEIRVRDPKVCKSCSTKDCIRGGDGIPGCELNLFQPRKQGNMDCTFCLDCVHACPHDNVVVGVNPPGSELWRDPQRSGIGRFTRRPDLAALVVLLVFGAFSNAAGMIGPVLDWQDNLHSVLGNSSSLPATTIYFTLTLVIIPAACLWLTSWLSQRWSGTSLTTKDIALRFVYAIVPLGAAMWLAHYSFHFLTSYEAILPAGQRFAQEVGLVAPSDWDAAFSCCVTTPSWLLRLEILFLDLGLLLSLYTAYRIALAVPKPGEGSMRVLLPWLVLLVLLFVAGIWILFQPMQMRGTLAMTG